mmetsp:Transcript_25782/g.36689  ORF Transcript_25782/g.36689 Transcript_25782/m.36689 type:complete len:101 (+) Transcript_25782:830-1132(+)
MADHLLLHQDWICWRAFHSRRHVILLVCVWIEMEIGDCLSRGRERGQRQEITNSLYHCLPDDDDDDDDVYVGFIFRYSVQGQCHGAARPRGKPKLSRQTN